MFITNPEILDKKNLFECDKAVSDKLTKNGFSVFSIDFEKGLYFYIKTKELIAFLKKEGGE